MYRVAIAGLLVAVAGCGHGSTHAVVKAAAAVSSSPGTTTTSLTSTTASTATTTLVAPPATGIAPSTTTTTTTTPPVFSSRGHVVDESGNPLAGMFVATTTGVMGLSWHGVTDANGDYDMDCSGMPIILSPYQFGGPTIAASVPNLAYTFVGGGVTFADAPPAPCLAASEAPVVTTMHPGSVLTGHVINSDGSPVPGFQLLVTDARTSLDGRMVTYSFGISGAEFTIAGLPPGDILLDVNYGQYGETVHIDAGTTIVHDIELPPPPWESTTTTTAP